MLLDELNPRPANIYSPLPLHQQVSACNTILPYWLSQTFRKKQNNCNYFV